jgi:DNA repair photolyase
MINTQNQTYQKGRGAQYNPKNRFNQHQYESDSEYLQHLYVIKENNQAPKTQYIEVAPKTIVNKVNSPDLGFSYSMNPYQGCEHGCVYCFARTTHEFWGYSAGIDFENKILVKKDAPKLLEKQFKSKKWKVLPIMLSGNTDCYQPIEKQYGITREVLKMCLKYQHPVSIITKNHLIQRDLDILSKLTFS